MQMLGYRAHCNLTVASQMTDRNQNGVLNPSQAEKSGEAVAYALQARGEREHAVDKAPELRIRSINEQFAPRNRQWRHDGSLASRLGGCGRHIRSEYS